MHDALTTLCDALDAALPPDRAELAQALAVATYRRLPDADLARLDVDAARRRVVRALEAFEEGSVDRPTISVEASDGTTVVHVHVTDGPFVLSTITEELHRLGLEPVDLAHPVVGVRRGPDGAIEAITAARHAEHRETYLALDLQTALGEPSREEVCERLEDVLGDALAVVSDFDVMRSRIEAVADDVRTWPDDVDGDAAELADLLGWLLDDHFVFLGYRHYGIDQDAITVTPSSGLGILRDHEGSRYVRATPLDELPAAVRWQATEGPALHVARTTRESTVHRHARMMDIGLPDLDEDGTQVGRHRILGLLAQKAYVEPSSSVPVLRRKLAAILDAEDVVDHSQDERALRTLFDAMPKQELFESDLDELRRSLVALLDLGRRGDVRLMVRTERSGGSMSVLVTVPRERFSAELRQDVQHLLAERVGAESVDYQLSMTEREQPLLHFTLRLPVDTPPPEVDVESLRQEIARLCRTFADAVAEALAASRGAVEGRRLADAWAPSLPPAYAESVSLETAVIDLQELEQLAATPDEPVRLRLVTDARAGSSDDDRDGLLRVRLYKSGEGVELSGFVPLLESLGLTVVEEHPHLLVDTPAGPEAHLHDYGVRCDIATVDVDADGPRIADAAARMWAGEVEVDSLNRLVVTAGTGIGEVAVLRAYRRYLRQIGTTYTEATTNDALLEYPGVARALLAHFTTRFDPDHEGDRLADVAATRDAVLAELDRVTRLDQDRILRSFLGVIDATLRTNAWQGRPWLALKLDSAAVPGVPKPVPYREIFVHSPRMEGIHLRGGAVARGGLRWSDRMDDFRTEVLGLMKAQVSKNAVIVPTGSKGGFVLKQRPSDPTELRAEVESQYRVFIRGMLDLTDDIEEGQAVGPDRVVRTDGDDPYLVVAADRGTATFSDVANGISHEYGFWLDDAFASGGSSGYDHKAMGITARGAWVAVQRHFRELGVDVQTEPVSVVGVGDMSGDVFGNGMLRSRAIRLVAAFDHRDVFLDPDPDPEAAFEERARLYDVPRSSWQDYDRDLISEGGGVWPRTAKSIPISAQAKEALRIDDDALSPPELIAAVLRAPVDLVWFGGIGTYVKSREETHADVGDRANDGIRVDAHEVAARVVGEGGNLAMTQRGRIAYGRRGGRCNTDAVDNVAGVNTSDREVNLKILLRLAIEDGRLDAADRDELLASVTDEVAAQVLRDSYLQTWAVSQDLALAPGGMGGYEMLMARLESEGRLDRDVEVLPGTAEVDARRAEGAGMTRAELCVLLAYAKIDLTAALVASDLIDQPVFDAVRRDYFPGPVAERFGDLADRHRLRRELVATVVANDVCNRMGITWAGRTAADLGTDQATVAGAWWIARQVIDADAEWRAVEALDERIMPPLQLELKSAVDWLVDAFARSYARLGRVDDIARAVAEDRGPYLELAGRGRRVTASSRARRAAQTAGRWIDLGIDEDLAQHLASLASLALVPGMAETARTSGRTVTHCGEVYALVAERLPLDRLSGRLHAVEPDGRWERGQHRGLIDDVRRLHHAVARRAIAESDDGADPAALVDRFLDDHAVAVERATELVHQVEGTGDPDLHALAVAVRALSEITG